MYRRAVAISFKNRLVADQARIPSSLAYSRHSQGMPANGDIFLTALLIVRKIA
jgi:hypothetical protein